MTTHAATFCAKNDVERGMLSDKVWKDSKKVGTISDTPGFRLAKYYHYVDQFNKYYEAKIHGKKSLKDKKRFNEFLKTFEDVKKQYFRVEYIIYLNLLYSIGLLQHKFLSMPVVPYPSRMSGPLREKLEELEIVKKGEVIGGEIYSDKNVEIFLNNIEKAFNGAYKALEKEFEQLTDFQILPNPIPSNTRINTYN